MRAGRRKADSHGEPGRRDRAVCSRNIHARQCHDVRHRQVAQRQRCLAHRVQGRPRRRHAVRRLDPARRDAAQARDGREGAEDPQPCRQDQGPGHAYGRCPWDPLMGRRATHGLGLAEQGPRLRQDGQR